MERPASRPVPADPEDVMCAASFASVQQVPPFHDRRGLATIRPRQVETFGAARLICDCLHEGPHRWPPVYDPLVPGNGEEPLPGDDLDEIEILPE